jgi:hypothetical protein
MATTIFGRGYPLILTVESDNLLKAVFNVGTAMAITSAGLISATFSAADYYHDTVNSTTMTATDASATDIAGTTLCGTSLCASTVAIVKASSTGLCLSNTTGAWTGNCLCGVRFVVFQIGGVNYHVPAFASSAASS